ncbi:hypothetical protein [Acinetobacter baumannii]|nr:hypothetical protein [Acinetobacter baumannii]
MPTRYNTGEYSYDLEYHYGDMSASMEMLRAFLMIFATSFQMVPFQLSV